MLALVVSLALCRQCVGNSEGFPNVEKSRQLIGGSKSQKNIKESGQSSDQLLEVVEVKYFKITLELLTFTFALF